jgi:hypothetical protein
MMAMCAARLNEPDLAVNLLVGKYDQNPFRALRLHRSPPRSDADVHARERRLALRRRHDGRRLGRHHHPRSRLPQRLACPLRRPPAHAIARTYSALMHNPDCLLVAPQGFEPRLIGSEPTVLPLNEGAAAGKALSRSREQHIR